MVIDKKKHSDKPGRNQGSSAAIAEPNKIAASTHFDFQGKNLTPYGGLFPVGTMLERLGFEKLVNETLTVRRIPRVMTIYQFVLGMVLAIYVGFARLNHLRFVAQDPMLIGILKVSRLPGQSVFWRFLASLNLNLAGQLLQLQRILRERVWAAAHVGLTSITLDAGLAAHPSRRWATNCVHFQLVMLAYNLNCWLLLFQREEGVAVDNLEHTRLATARLRFLFVAAKIWKHSGRVGISYSDQYAERGLFQRLMKRLREITNGPAGFLPVLATPLSG